MDHFYGRGGHWIRYFAENLGETTLLLINNGSDVHEHPKTAVFGEIRGTNVRHHPIIDTVVFSSTGWQPTFLHGSQELQHVALIRSK